MTESQEKRLDLKIIFWAFNAFYVLVLGWNVILFGALFSIIGDFFLKIVKAAARLRDVVMEWYIRVNKIERDGKIGKESKFNEY